MGEVTIVTAGTDARILNCYKNNTLTTYTSTKQIIIHYKCDIVWYFYEFTIVYSVLFLEID